MGALKILTNLCFISSVVLAQTPLYSPEVSVARIVQHGNPSNQPSYRVVPRLVPVQSRGSPYEGELRGSEARGVRVATDSPPVFATTGPPSYASPLSYAYVRQPEEAPPVIKRIRVVQSSSPVASAASPTSYTYPYNSGASPSPYASPYASAYPSNSVAKSQGQPIQYAQALRAGSPYKTYASAAYPVPQYYQHISSPSVVTKSAPAPVQVIQAQPKFQAARVPIPVAAPAPRPLLRLQKAKQAEVEVEEDEYPSDQNPQYNFAFDVKDDDFTNYQNRQETRDGGVIKGSYSVVDPDGYVRTVTYEATPKGGFQAKVTREPTDVKIKFPVPTLAPEQEEAKTGGGRAGPGGLQYVQAHQPQYAAAPAPRRYPYRFAPAPQQQYIQQ